MTSYMYNPSKKITEFLSNYLAFDSEQLQLGIWSGHVSLSNVELKPEAIEPLLNKVWKTGETNDNDDPILLPPVQLKLVSGTVGTLQIKIPWKRLVWGQSDVKLEVRNVTLVVTLASAARSSDPGSPTATNPLEEEEDALAGGKDDKESKQENDDGEKRTKKRQRERKQKRLREAEYRRLRSQPLATWLAALYAKDAYEQAAAETAAKEAAATPLQSTSRLERFLRGATSDFFWRFYAGLQAKVENVKIVMVQDGVEVGLVVPLIEVTAGKAESADKQASKQDDEVEQESSDVGPTVATPPQNIVYEGAYDDGEHVDKTVKLRGLGSYVRRVPRRRAESFMMRDVSTFEYLLRPLDIHFSFSLFYPYPPEKRKRRDLNRGKNMAVKEGLPASVDSAGTSTSSKRRRGKREKIHSESNTVKTEQETIPPIPIAPVFEMNVHRRVQSGNYEPSMLPHPTLPRPLAIRRASTVATSASAGRQSFPSGHSAQPRNRTGQRYPLAAPQGSAYTTMHGSSVNEGVDVSSLPLSQTAYSEYEQRKFANRVENMARFDATMKIGAIQVICSSRHYELMHLFAAACVKARNGRPDRTIISVLEFGHAMQRTLTVPVPSAHLERAVAPTNSAGAGKLRTMRLELDNAKNERAEVVRIWWKYACDVIVSELRKRKYIREIFQKRFLSFSWEKQHYRRREYVQYYIARLVSRPTESATFSTNYGEDALFALEDELPIEQILLYRSLSRAAHVRGMSEFPASILDLHIESQEHREKDETLSSSDDDAQGNICHADLHAKTPSNEAGSMMSSENGPTLLGRFENDGRLARRRRDIKHGDFLPSFLQQMRIFNCKIGDGAPHTLDEESFALTTDKTLTSSKSRRTRHQSPSSEENKSERGMTVNVSFSIEKLELILVEDNNSDNQHLSSQCRRLSDESMGGFSGVSGLTVDERVWDDVVDDEGARYTEDESHEDIVLTSTDYLIFRMPQHAVLWAKLSPIAGVLWSSTGNQRSMTVTLGGLEIFGEDKYRVVSIGSSTSNSSMSGQSSGKASSYGDHFKQVDALKLSFVLKSSRPVWNCDVAAVDAWLDFDVASKILLFTRNYSAKYPQNCLPRSGREELRLYFMQQDLLPHISFMNCSVRIHGFYTFIALPSSDGTPGSREKDRGSDQGNDLDDSSGRSAEEVVICVNMIEFYSGPFVEEIASPNHHWHRSATSFQSENPRRRLSSLGEGVSVEDRSTRQLDMLDVADIMAARGSLLTQNWVITGSGGDVQIRKVVSLPGATPITIFGVPVDVELLCQVHEHSALDSNRAQREIVVEVSPVELLITEDRVYAVARIASVFSRVFAAISKTFPSPASILPPRVEVLSRFMMYTLDVRVRHMRFAVQDESKTNSTRAALTKESKIEATLVALLATVASFDLSFPNEEALSSAMQIALDRLTAVGMTLDDAWEVSNMCLMTFLEDMAEKRDSLSEQAAGSAFRVPHDKDCLPTSIAESTRRSMLWISERVQGFTKAHESRSFVTLDLPEGLSLIFVKLFYDKYVSINVEAAFVTNREGLHLLRASPSVETPAAPVGTLTQSSNGSRNDDLTAHDAGKRVFGLEWRTFYLDREFAFGRGGFSLDALGDDGSSLHEARERELISDLGVGDMEILFGADAIMETFLQVNELLGTFSQALLGWDDAQVSKEVVGPSKNFLLAVPSLSILLVADDLTPFSRLFMSEIVVRVTAPRIYSSMSLSAKAISLLNLTPDAGLYSTAIISLTSSSSLRTPVYVEGDSKSSRLQVNLYGLRVVVLRQFLTEFLQFIGSDDFGFGKLAAQSRKRSEAGGAGFNWQLELGVFDISLLLPRHATSSDIVALETSEARVQTSRVPRTFAMPSQTSELEIYNVDASRIPDQSEDDSGFEDCFEDMTFESSPRGLADDEFVPRKMILIRECNIYTSLLGGNVPCGKEESLMLNYTFAVDGRANANKLVYSQLNGLESEQVDAQESQIDVDKSERRWKQVTRESLYLDVIVDYAPHFRLLMCNACDGSLFRFNLDLQIAQFCMLLSVWYCNMQELPVFFPFTVEQIVRGTKLLEEKVKLPDLGSQNLREFLMDESTHTSEIAIVASYIAVRFSPDDGDFHLSTAQAKPRGIRLEFAQAVVHIVNDQNSVTRVGFASLDASVKDDDVLAPQVLRFNDVVEVGWAWADIMFGVEDDIERLGSGLAQRFQLTAFIAKEWSLYNLGLDAPLVTLTDFTPFTKFLEYVAAYFQDPLLGNPLFEVQNQVNKIARDCLGASGVHENHSIIQKVSTTDFRLWSIKPTLLVPCFTDNSCAAEVLLTSHGGLWYRFRSGDSNSSQEVVAQGLQMSYNFSDHSGTMLELPLIEGLSFGLRVETDVVTKHVDISVQVPFTRIDSCSIVSKRIEALPMILPRQTVCVPYKQPERFLGPKICEMTCVVEALPNVSAALMGLFSGSSSGDKNADEQLSECVQIESWRPTLSFVGQLQSIRIFALDPVLGPHLPIGVISIAFLAMTASTFSLKEETPVFTSGHSPPDDFQMHVEGNFWGDYFKLGMTRSWEPFLEPYSFTARYEISRFRGSGLYLDSDTPFHVNISGALLLILDEIINSFSVLVRSVLDSNTMMQQGKTAVEGVRKLAVSRISDRVESGPLIQEIPKYLRSGDRVAFSLRNMTGQKIRFYRRESAAGTEFSVISYIDQAQSVKLDFYPSVSSVKNMAVVEVDYPGFPKANHKEATCRRSTNHVVDLQLPGFRWARQIMVDTFGRSFEEIIPNSKLVLNKAGKDWRLANVMRILVEVGLENGGRQVTLQSLFSFTNRTSHDVCLLLDPDAMLRPKVNKSEAFILESLRMDAHVLPGETYFLPTLLLESALRMNGSHLGSLWVRPNLEHSLSSLLLETWGSTDAKTSEVSYSGRAVQLAKVVSETAAMFAENEGKDIDFEGAKSGIQLSCSIASEDGSPLAPFCYALEVSRSPVVRSRSSYEHQSSASGVRNLIHGPVAYTLNLHPPLSIVNLLPIRGRFELMHAVRLTVLWFSDLDPGEEVKIHSVGLDAPLLLLLNLGFCRTPVGEGALVHHGVDPPPGARENLVALKSIGRAGKAVTKQLGKTLASLGESPDRRAQAKLGMAHDMRSRNKVKVPEKIRNPVGKTDLGLENDASTLKTIGDVKSQVYKTETSIFFPHDVAVETVLVDRIGQRLILSIDNNRGGGGQRSVTVFCPFWIVNTTEHALKYKQDKSKSFVSGTVHDASRDGSMPFSGGRALAKTVNSLDTKAEHGSLRSGTVFAGMPGVLATSPGKCELSMDELGPLLDQNLPLELLSKFAFMFNFNEGILNLGHQRLCVQLANGSSSTEYTSDWSRGFSLESVGFSQVISLHCKDGRALELTVVVNVAPGPLSGYTKIVRLLPRYMVINHLACPIRLWQDNSIFRPLSSDNNENTSRSKRWQSSHGEMPKTRRINQYESLWGRETHLDERGIERIASGSTASVSALFVTSVASSELVPFNLPDSRRDRQLRVGLGSPWNLTSSVSADMPGEHAMKITRAVDLRLLRHVSTRASPQYVVNFPPLDGTAFAGELGIWFETEWGSDRSLIVKAVKRGSYAFNQTDVHAGDELVLIDGALVSRMTFAEAMSKLRDRLSDIEKNQAHHIPQRHNLARRSSFRLIGLSSSSRKVPEGEYRPLLLTFRTIEERMRRVRLKAARNSGARTDRLERMAELGEFAGAMPPSPLKEQYASKIPAYITTEMKTVHHIMCLVVREEKQIPFEIQNCSIGSTIYYRQKSCYGHPWQCLRPGQSRAYTWEEPMKSKRLTLRVATQSSLAFQFFEEVEDGKSFEKNLTAEGDIKISGSRILRYLPFRAVQDEEETAFSSPLYVRLEEIGYRDFLAYTSESSHGQMTHFLEMEVDVIGFKRVLVVNDVTEDGNEEKLNHHLEALGRRLRYEMSRKQELESICSKLSQTGENCERLDRCTVDAECLEAAWKLMEDASNRVTIVKQHQILVEILEAVGLSPDSVVGECNPYVEAYLKSGVKSRAVFAAQKRRTYYVRKTVAPNWISQAFVFDVPPDAVRVTRGHSVNVRVRNFQAFGGHSVLGRVKVDLHSLRDQQILVGWFPLAGRTGRRELENPMSHWGRGSIKLRIQWVYTAEALVQYFALLSECRLDELQKSLTGMTELLLKKSANDKRRRDEADGFQAVRVVDLLSISRNQINRLRRGISKAVDPRDIVGKIIEPLRSSAKNAPGSHKASIKLGNSPAIAERRRGRALPSRLPVGRKSWYNSTTGESNEFKPNLLPLPPLIYELRDRFSKQRQNLQKVLSTHKLAARKRTFLAKSGVSGRISISSLKSWTAFQVLASDDRLKVTIDGSFLNVKTRLTEPVKRNCDDGSCDLVFTKLGGHRAQDSIAGQVLEYAKAFSAARNTFERAARRMLRTVLHPGGWLTIRPVTALNLSESYNSMFVKVKFGSETLSSGSADSKVYPTWCVGCRATEDRAGGEIDSPEDYPNDLHVFIAPQRTSGTIHLSVVGERKHQKINTKTELGVLHFSLGAAISASLECIEELQNETGTSSPFMPRMFLRWFPLMSPRDAVPVEGDRRLSLRPSDTEKTSDHLFHEYFTPCIQLGLLWRPGPFEDDGDVCAHPSEVHSERRPQNPPVLSDSSRPNPRATLVQSYVVADVGGISVALIDSQRAVELLSFSATEIDMHYWTTLAKTRIGITIGWVQVDHQASNAREPVILAPTPHDALSTVVHILAVKDNIRSKSHVLSFRFMDVSVAEFDLTIEETFLFELYDFLSALKLRRITNSRLTVSSVGPAALTGHKRFAPTNGFVPEAPELATALSALAEKDLTVTRRIYIEQLFLGVVRINLSYLKGKNQQFELTRDGTWIARGIDGFKELPHIAMATGERLWRGFAFHDEESDIFLGWSQQTSDDDRLAEEKGAFLQTIPSLLAVLLPNVSDAPVRLQGKALNHVFETPSEILHSIKKFYANETLKQVYKIIGSLDFVGNPTMLLSSFVSGVRDLVLTPSQAFMQSPTDPSVLGMGVAKGTLSLFSHSASGFFGFLSKLSAAGGQGIATLSLDADYRAWHRDKIVTEATNLNRVWKRRGVQSIGAMLTRPIGDILLGAGAGVSGIILSPVKGYKKGGALGCAKGFAIGSLGLLAKPTVGVFDAFAHFTASVHDIAKSVNVLEKRHQPAIKHRLPYVFGLMNIMAPFDPAAARASLLIKSFSSKKSRRAVDATKEILVHVEVLSSSGVDTFIIVSSLRVLVVRVKKEASGSLSPAVCWEVSHTGGVADASSRITDHGHNGVALTVTLTTKAPAGYKPSEVVSSLGDDMAVIPENISGIDPNTGLDSPRSVGPRESVFDHPTEEFEYGTGKSTGGDSVEWFTILAEYQFRKQLARIHNAISCLVGDFKAIVYEQALGPPGSDFGYTSFGMYNFEKSNGSTQIIPAQHSLILNSLESLPWVSRETFAICQDFSPAEQESYLSEKGLTMCLENEVEATLREGHTSWFAKALAEATYTGVALGTCLDAADPSPTHRRTQSNPLPATSDEDSGDKPNDAFHDNDDDELPPTHPARMLDFISSEYLSTREFPIVIRDDQEDDVVSGRTRVESPAGNSEAMTRASLQWRKSTESAETASFYSALSSESSMSALPKYNSRPHIRDRALSDSFLTRSRLEPVQETRSETAAELENLQTRAAVQGGWVGEHPSTGTLATRTEERIERMEALMERLLIFSADQALSRAESDSTMRNDSADSSEQHILWREIAELKARVANQDRSEREAEREIAILRQHLNDLRAQIATGGAVSLEDAVAGEPPPSKQDDESTGEEEASDLKDESQYDLKSGLSSV